jgi:Protein of unknown function (DUF1553)/Protein of unknown function (DUF1549)
MNRLICLLLCLHLGVAAAIASADDDAVFTPQQKAHWAWQTPKRPAIPSVKQFAWAHNPIDAFVLAKLESKGLAPSPSADPVTLLRRLYFDLIGLPPTPAQVDEFVAAWDGASAKRQAVLEKVIDQLLASPHYGERWGRHWLDLARFAESNGYEFDEIRPDAWRYRDYVIRAFNADKPYDRFIVEQLAGDELFPDDADARIATGFNLLGPDMTDSSNQAQRRQNTLDDMTDTTGLVFLGMTIGCARCHDHKFEPIAQADFYRVQAFFAPADFRKDVPVASKTQLAAHAQAQARYGALIQPALDAIGHLEEPYRAKAFEKKLANISDEARTAHRTSEAKRTLRQQELVNQTARLVAMTVNDVLAIMSKDDRARHEQLRKTLQQFDSQKPAPLPVAMGLQDIRGPLPKTYLLQRGELNHRGEEIQPAWPLILSPEHAETRPLIAPPAPHTTGRRAALARWIASPEHPLTARVLVNRLWQHHFGRGIVATASDFGVRGQPPTHPELLDWLATEFIARGWSVKQMHKLMLLSATYQQSSSPRMSAAIPAGAGDQDPDNQLFSRMNRCRLEGEIIRDSLLAVSGRLNDKMGGPGVFPPLPPESKVSAKDWPVTAAVDEHCRRSVYLFARRNLRIPFLETFDLPDSNQSCPKRQQSTTGPQALALLNSAEVTAAAQALAKRLEKEAPTTDERVTLAFRIAFGRRPSADESASAREFLRESPLSELCRALLNANEFVYVD